MRQKRSPWWRILSWLGWLAAALVLLLLASFAVPLREWRTGRLPAEPLDLVAGGPAVAMPKRVWIDTDAACGHGETTDADDCFAILLLAQDPAVHVVGISTVHGNAPLEVTDATTRALIAQLAPRGTGAIPVYRGSAALLTAGPAQPAPAHAALLRALHDGPLTVLGLGPLTNVAAALAAEPRARSNVARLVAVMGRRPGHLFHPAEGKGSGALLFGHGPVFRDFNYEQDRAAAKSILQMGIPITLVPYDAARTTMIIAADLARLQTKGGAFAWVADRARGWLRFWNERVGREGFYPFDLIAAAYVLDPRLFDCARTPAWIANDEKLWRWFYNPEALMAGPVGEKPAQANTEQHVIYCPQTRLSVRSVLDGAFPLSR